MVFEGTPGAGKTSSIAHLHAHLQVEVLSQLDHTEACESVPEERVQAWYVQEEMARQPRLTAALEEGKMVLQDRSALSILAFAFAAARTGKSGAFRHSAMLMLRQSLGRLIEPDLLIVMTSEPERGFARRVQMAGEPRSSVWRDMKFLLRHRDFYFWGVDHFPAKRIVTIDTSAMTQAETLDAITVLCHKELDAGRS